MSFIQSHANIGSSPQTARPRFQQITNPLAEAYLANQQRLQQPPEQSPGLMEQITAGFGGGLGEGIAGGIKQGMRRSVLEKALGMMNPNMSPLEKYKIVAMADPETQQALLPYLQMENEQQAATQARAQKQQDLEAQRRHEFEKIHLQNQGRLEIAQAKKKNELNPVEKKVQEGIANSVAHTFEQIPELEGNRSTIKELRVLSQKLRGAKGLVSGLGAKFGVGGQEAATFNTLGLAAIEPIIKIFNPTGAIATEKMNLIRQQTAPQATDTFETMKGKLDALEFLNNRAEQRAKRIEDLYEKYDGDIPAREMLRINRENEAEIDKFLRNSGIPKAELDAVKLQAQQSRGQKIRLMKNGKAYDIPEEFAEQALSQGFTR